MLSCSQISDITSLAGSPFYLCDGKRFADNLGRMTAAFSSRWPKFVLAYSYKTNYLPYLCKLAKDKGAWAEVVSRLEYNLARKIGQPADKIIFNGPVKSYEDIAFALDSGSLVNLDSASELDGVVRYAKQHPDKKIPIGLRINIDLTDSQGISHIQNRLPHGRFGLTPSELKAESWKLAANLHIISLHGHTSSADRNIEGYRVITRTLADIAHKHFAESIQYLNIGGGFFGDVPPQMGFQNVPMFDDYAEAVADVLKSYTWHNPPCLVIEPGLALAADTVSLAARVVSVKTVAGKMIITVDASVYHLKPTLHARNLPYAVIVADSKPRPQGCFSVVGSTCMEKDYLLTKVSGTIPAVGDYLYFTHCGAYSIVLTPPFIHPAPAIVSVDGGKVNLLRTRQTLDQMFANYIF